MSPRGTARGSVIKYELLIALPCLALATVFGTMAHFRVPLFRSDPAVASLEKTTLDAKLLSPADSLCVGSPGATTKLIMFGDYECPPCRAEWPTIEKLVAKHSGQLAVYFRHYPLVRIHPSAYGAAVAAECAKAFGRFSEMHRKLYGSGLSNSSIKADFTDIGISTPPTDAQLTEASHRVATDMNLAMDLGLKGTPSLFYVDRSNQVYLVHDLTSVEFHLN